MLDFQATARTRHSVRQFLDKPLTKQEIVEVLTDAQKAPSATNTQPWRVYLASGETLNRLKERIMQKFEQGEFKPDFVYDQSKYGGIYENRWRTNYQEFFATFGVERGDKDGRAMITRRNAELYDAPHAAFLFMPDLGDGNVNVASDMGMYSQTFLLSLHARGFGGVPMLFLAMFADVVREELGVSPDLKLLHGIAFGYPDPNSPQNKYRSSRVALDESVTLLW